jgi:hypothetical protein
MTLIFENCSPSTARRGGCHSAMSRTFYDEVFLAAMWSSHNQLIVNLNRRISDGITDMKNMTSLQVFKSTMQYRLERGRECWYANGLGILELDGKICELKNRKKDKTFAARKLIGSDHHRVFMYAPDLSVSNQKKNRQRRLAILSDFPLSFSSWVGTTKKRKLTGVIYYKCTAGID